jgi:uncharacterized LabA/DUF88 family protein
MKTIALLIDGEYFAIALRIFLHLPTRPTADQVYRNILGLFDPAIEEPWRIFYYDSLPFTGSEQHPVTGEVIDYGETQPARTRKAFLAELGQKDLVALRCGQTKPQGWQLTDSYCKRLGRPPIQPPTAKDYEMRFEQKGVDTRIGIDIATLSIDRIVDRILIASNDTDLIPAMKLARREGVQIIIPKLGSFNPHRDLVEDADFKRPYNPVA